MDKGTQSKLVWLIGPKHIWHQTSWSSSERRKSRHEDERMLLLERLSAYNKYRLLYYVIDLASGYVIADRVVGKNKNI